jgi:hypothetical protein
VFESYGFLLCTYMTDCQRRTLTLVNMEAYDFVYDWVATETGYAVNAQGSVPPRE